jgi:hypothetical protein
MRVRADHFGSNSWQRAVAAHCLHFARVVDPGRTKSFQPSSARLLLGSELKGPRTRDLSLHRLWAFDVLVIQGPCSGAAHFVDVDSAAGAFPCGCHAERRSSRLSSRLARRCLQAFWSAQGTIWCAVPFAWLSWLREGLHG